MTQLLKTIWISTLGLIRVQMLSSVVSVKHHGLSILLPRFTAHLLTTDRFARAYARKMLSEHPAQLHFAVSSDGRFSIPKSKQANMLIFDLPGKNGLITYEMVKNTDLPSIIKPETPNTTVAGHTLLAELDLTLHRYWGN